MNTLYGLRIYMIHRLYVFQGEQSYIIFEFSLGSIKKAANLELVEVFSELEFVILLWDWKGGLT